MNWVLFYDIYSDSQSELQSSFGRYHQLSVGYGDVVYLSVAHLEWSGVWQASIQQLKILQAKLICFLSMICHHIVKLLSCRVYRYAQSVRCGHRSLRQMRDKLLAEGLTVNKILIQRMWGSSLWSASASLSLRLSSISQEVWAFSTSDQLVLCTPSRDFSPEEESKSEANVSYCGWVARPELLLELSKGGLGQQWVLRIIQRRRAEYWDIISLKCPLSGAGIPVIVLPWIRADSRRRVLGFVVDSLEEASRIVENRLSRSIRGYGRAG